MLIAVDWGTHCTMPITPLYLIFASRPIQPPPPALDTTLVYVHIVALATSNSYLMGPVTTFLRAITI
jgi:hypothetical protein